MSIIIITVIIIIITTNNCYYTFTIQYNTCWILKL